MLHADFSFPQIAPARWLGLVLLGALLASLPASAQQTPPDGAPDFTLAGPGGPTDILVDPADFPVVRLAAGLLADDVARVTGHRPAVYDHDKPRREVVLIGTLGHSAHLDELDHAGRLARSERLRGGWETTVRQVIDHPWPGVDRALVIAGSDRRGAAYGAMAVSESIGVSPWYWWADVPVAHQETLTLPAAGPAVDSPAVKYRGIFINDEDWGLKPWAAKTFDPALGNIGPKTYARIFELMLRLRLNYLWPAMHPCSREFAATPENAALADQYAIVMGASHCEPMLRNNVWYSVKEHGPWNYGTNRDGILAYWEQSTRARGQYEAVWTEGIRGIHDAGMQGPPDVPGRVALLRQTILDQRELLDKYVTRQWGPVAQCFIPYKEVQPLYDAGLDVPADVTLVWADDNYGYLRRLSNPQEHQRPGGAGIYYHLSYFGGPQSYLWLNTTPPALMWEEMRKAWDNAARTIWMVNVGDIKPGEVGIDFLARLAWNVDAYGSDAQPEFLRDFARRAFGSEHADEIAALYAEYYRLGQIRKPETMTSEWAASLPADELAALARSYTGLIGQEKTLAALLPATARDAWTELAGYPARMLAASGLIFVEDRLARDEPARRWERSDAINGWRKFITSETAAFNEQVAGGKWRGIMSSGEDQGRLESGGWSSWANMAWPWIKEALKSPLPPAALTTGSRTVPAAAGQRGKNQAGVRWIEIAGLGRSGRALAWEPATPKNAEDLGVESSASPALTYDFICPASGGAVMLHLLPTFRLYPGMKLRLAVAFDDGAAQMFEVPGSSGSEDENGRVRRNAVRDNRVDLAVPCPALSSDRRHTLKIQAFDPGVVLDEITLP